MIRFSVWAVLLVYLGCVIAENRVSLSISITDQSYSLSFGKLSLESSPFQVRINGVDLSTQDGSLVLGAVNQDQGQDAIGQFDSTEFIWQDITGNSVWSTRFRTYSELPTIVFEQQYLVDATSTSSGDEDTVSSYFPSFYVPKDSSNAFLTYQGNMACPGGQIYCTIVGLFSDMTFFGGVAGGGPVVLFNEELTDTAIISALSNFMSGSFVYDNSTGILSWGTLGSVLSIEKGYSLQTIVHIGDGINSVFYEWGSLLQTYYGTNHFPNDDVTVNYISYYTDNGGYYYYLTEENKTYQDTLLDVWEYSKENNIPYRSFQLDSWWYYKDENGAVTNWIAMPSIFPDGIEYFSAQTQLPLTAHNRYWSNSTVYATANGGDYNFIIDGEYSIPDDLNFWKDLFLYSRQWGLSVYEQDWLYNEYTYLSVTLQSTSLARNWLLQMGEGARQAGIHIQYCMPYPRFYLQSLEIPAITQIRVSDDYGPGGSRADQWSIGDSALLADALGLRPFKDTFWTTSIQVGNRYDSYEPAPALEAVVATLSTGPVGPSDAIGNTDVDLLSRSHTKEGLILKPSKALTSIDYMFLARTFGNQESTANTGEIMSTYSEINGWVFRVLLGAQVKVPLTIYPADIPANEVSDELVYKSFSFLDSSDKSATTLYDFDDSNGILLSECEKPYFDLWYTSPVFPDGTVLLGELDKWVPVSPNRINKIITTSTQTSIQITGSPEEVVTFYFYNSNSQLDSITCEFTNFGTANINIQHKTCQ